MESLYKVNSAYAEQIPPSRSQIPISIVSKNTRPRHSSCQDEHQTRHNTLLKETKLRSLQLTLHLGETLRSFLI
jgi:hypothetical protein